jgi:hypothetical protein
MEDRVFELYRRKVCDRIRVIDRDVTPAPWWDTVIRYYYDHGFSEQLTAQTVVETMKK